MKKLFLYSSMLGMLASFSGCFTSDEVKPGAGSKKTNQSVQDTPADSNVSNCEPVTADFLAGQHIPAGNITVTNDLTNLYVTFNTTNGWLLSETHLYVGKREGLPAGKKGNPKIGNFPYKATLSPAADTYSYTIPLSSLGNDPCIVVAAHASVAKYGPNGEILQQETAWGAGQQIAEGGSWASYFVYCICNNNGGGEGGVGGN